VEHDLITRPPPQGASQQNKSIVTPHRLTVKDVDILKWRHSVFHGCHSIINVRKAGVPDFQITGNPDDRLPLLGTPLKKRAQVRIV
jgi:hypothetical protein